jgi:ER lumen protein retaining receptor
VCALLAIFTGVSDYRSSVIPSVGHAIVMYFWAFSLWAEALAVLPQMILLGRGGRVDALNREHLFFMSIYRLLYLLNWVYQIVKSRGQRYPVLYITGVLQTAIYADFIWVYCRAKVKGEEFELPR